MNEKIREFPIYRIIYIEQTRKKTALQPPFQDMNKKCAKHQRVHYESHMVTGFFKR
jgi:hypothetical protein